MKAFFEYIKAQINASVPAIKTVRMWNNQFAHSNNSAQRPRTGFRDEKAFKYPACFIEFVVNEVNALPLGIKDYFLTVRFRFGLEHYTFERLNTFDFCDDFSKAIQMMAPTTASGLTFTTFQESSSEFDEDHDNVDIPFIDYRTRYRSSVAYTRASDIEHGPITPVATGEIIEFSDL